MKRLDSSEIVCLIGKAADAFLLAACLHHRLRWVEPCWSIWWCFIFRCASIFWIQISLPKIIFCIPNIHPPAEMPGLLVDVWSVTAAGQNHHLLPLDSEADFDPCQAPFSYLTLHCLIFNKSSSPKRRTYQIFYLVQKIAVMQRKKDLSSVDVFIAAWFFALSLRLLVIRNWGSTCF